MKKLTCLDCDRKDLTEADFLVRTKGGTVRTVICRYCREAFDAATRRARRESGR